MAVAAVTKTQILSDLHGTLDAVAGINLTWAAMALNDTGAIVTLPGNADKSIQVTGTMGAGGSVTLEGSNDGVNFSALTDPTGTVIAITVVNSIKAVTEAVQFIRPHATAGDGTTSVVVVVFCRNTQMKF